MPHNKALRLLVLLIAVLALCFATRGGAWLLLQIPHFHAILSGLLLVVIIDAVVNAVVRRRATPKQKLLTSLKDRFFPFLTSKGFRQLKGREKFNPSTLLYTFVREEEGRFDLFEFRFDKYGFAQFQVRLGRGPVDIGQAFLRPAPLFFPRPIWFRPRKVALFFGPRRYHAVAKQLERLFPECEAYWASGQCGTRVRTLAPLAPRTRER